ncbi:MAG: PfkB family carbohydrate kinase [Proteobacteria bacterium]|jgi:sugar/nucleoside kinase (ribokinase family)|nr:PfkB family carbohydrate kinase [Pseudomonadota bacterium]
MTIIPTRSDLACLAVGAVTRDRYGAAVEIGGAAYYAARVFSELGAASCVATRTHPSLLARGELTGIDCRCRAGDDAALFINTYGENGARSQWVESAAPEIEPGDLPDAWSAPDALFLCPVLGEVPLTPWLNATRARFVALGVQGFLKTAGPGAPGSRRPVVRATFDPAHELLSRVDAAFLSEEDLALASPDLLDRLRASVGFVALTRGAKGARIYRDGGVAEIGIYPTTAVDPTGAGDAFAAACLFALAAGEDPLDAARLGAAAASIVIEGIAGSQLHRVGEALYRARKIPTAAGR